MIDKPLEKIEISDIELLQHNAVAERRTLDFKLELPGGKDEDKREFLADVTSFGNTDGGDLIFGVAEDTGVITAIPGLQIDDFDALKLRLENSVRDGTEPRLRVNFHKVDSGGKSLIVLRVDKSWARPHRARFGKWDKFYGRNSAGKFPLDVNQLRDVFLEVSSVGERIASFHAERLLEISNGRAPFPLEDRPTVIFHLIPLSSMSGSALLDVRTIFDSLEQHKLFDYYMRRRDYTFEGVLTHSDAFQDGRHAAYGHFYRNGTVELVGTDSLTRRDDVDRGKFIPAWDFENEVNQSVRDGLQSMAAIGLNPPVVLALSVFRVKGLSIARGPKNHRKSGNPIREDILTFPGLMIEDFRDSISRRMRPIFDQFWNACGLPASESYDENGEWIARRPQ